MAFEPIYEVAALDGLQKLCSGQVVAEAKLVPPHGEEITKILGVSAVADVTATEVFTGEARIKGKVDFRVLYSDTNGQSRCLEYRTEFTDKIADDAITGGQPCVISKILDTDIVSASESEVRLAAVVETELFGQTSKRIKYLINGGDSIYSRESKMDYTKVVASFKGGNTITAESAIAASSIACVESRACITKAMASTNMVVVEGEVVSDVIYQGEGGMAHACLTTPFVYEVEADGALSGCDVYATARICSEKASVIVGEENTVLISYELEASGFVCEQRCMTSIADVFSVQNELNKQVDRVDFTLLKQCAYVSDEVEGSVTLKSGLPIVDSIITPLGSSVILSTAYATQGKVTIEGIVRASIIYFSGESNSCNSVAVELPFSTSKPIDAQDGDVVFASGEVLGIYTKIRRGNEIDVRASVKFSVLVSEKIGVNVISELSQGEQIEPPKCAISMHVASKKESLWDVAKILCATPEAVMEQNPELNFPLNGGERIICFRRLGK